MDGGGDDVGEALPEASSLEALISTDGSDRAAAYRVPMPTPPASPRLRPAGDLSTLMSAYARAVYRIEIAGRRLYLRFAASAAAAGVPPPVRLPARWSILTAWNPGPVVLDDAANAARHQQLADRVSRLGLPAWPSLASDIGGRHAEPGLLIESITREQTIELARTFAQVAAVHGVHACAGVLYTCSERWIVLPARWTSRQPLCPA